VTPTEVLIAIVIAVGIAGIVVPVLPGTILVLGAMAVWATEVGTSRAWIVFAVATTFLAVGAVVKYAVPHRRLRDAGVPQSTLVFGGLVGFVGFFVIPVIGILVGFVLGVYAAELRRVGGAAAWPATVHALKAVGVSVLVELIAAVLAALTWAVGVVVTP
jgi:uncharacterized protein